MSGPALNVAVGAPLQPHFRVRPEAQRYWRALKEVRDPELPISVVDMGLIYDIRETATPADSTATPADSTAAAAGDPADAARDPERTVRLQVTMTFTATACPCMELITMDIRDRLLRESGVEAVEIEVVWDPPWTRSMITEEGRARLRKLGVAA